MRRRFRRTIGIFPNPLVIPPKSLPGVLKTNRVAIDLDSPDYWPEFLSRLRRYRSLIEPLVDTVIVERGGRGVHILFLLRDYISLRDNMAIRLLLYDDPLHVAYDMFASLYTPHFPNNVLFTRKRGKEYRLLYEGPLSGIFSITINE